MTMAGLSAPLAARAVFAAGVSERSAEGSLKFLSKESEFQFNTGTVKGTLRAGGKSTGFFPLIDCKVNTPIAGRHGIFSHYRLLDASARYGTAAWDWTSRAQVTKGDTVEVYWTADDEHPFDLRAVYRWTDDKTLDVTTGVTARKPLTRFESFLASYFDGFATAEVYVQETGNGPGFLSADPSFGNWLMFPRDDPDTKTINDGRWNRPPNPVEWKIMPHLASPLALRHDEQSGLTAVIMAPPQDCFAISTPFNGEGHRSLYLSLFGKDLKNGETATAHARLFVDRDVSHARARLLYRSYRDEIG